MPGLGGFRRVVVVLECRDLTLEVDGACLADRQLLALVVADVDHPDEWLAHRAGPFEPFVRIHVAEAVQLGTGVILVQDRAPPRDHLVLHLDGARCRRMHGDLVAGEVVLRAGLLGQLQHPAEHGRHPLAVGDAVALDVRQRFSGVEAVHDHRCAADRLRAGRERQGRRVVERRRREIASAFAESEDAAQQSGAEQIGVGDRRSVQRTHDALGATRSAGAVQHRRSPRLFNQRFGGIGRDGIFERVESVGGIVEHQPDVAFADERQHLGRHIDDGRRCHEHSGPAVVDDVRRLVGRQVAVDRGEVEAAAHRGPVGIEVADVVVGEDRHVIAGPEACRPHELRELAAAGLELAERPGVAVAGHDHRWTVRVGRRVRAGIAHGGEASGRLRAGLKPSSGARTRQSIRQWAGGRPRLRPAVLAWRRRSCARRSGRSRPRARHRRWR